MSKHTPGPWSKINICGGNEQDEFIIKKDQSVLANILVGMREHDENAANAALIAAAPDLLEALKRLLACPALNEEAVEPETLYAVKQAGAAIAKAEGRA